MKKAVFILLASALAAATVAAQNNPLDFSGINTISNTFGGLFDPSHFSMQQSFSMSYAASGKNSLLANTYCNSMKYRLSDKLTLKMDLAYSYLPAAFNNSQYRMSGSGQGLFLPSFGLKYQPNQNILIEFQYNNQGYGANRMLGR
jgi:hypothetical protein